MKRALVILLGLCMAFASAQDVWKTITSTEGKFTVKMPGTPQTSTQKYTRGKYTIPTTMYIVSKPTTNFVLTSSILPAGVSDEFVKTMFAETKTGFLQTVGGTSLTDKDGGYNGIQGRIMTFKAPNGAQGAFWMFVKNGRFYTLTLGKRSGDYADEQAKFFGSFHLKP